MFDYAIAVLEEHGLLEIAPRQAGAGRRAGPEDNLVRIGGEEHIDAFISRLSCFLEKSR